MPYSITRYAEHLIWVELEGHLTLTHAEHYFTEMWDLLDDSTVPTDLLVDGRRIAGAASGARRRTEQIAHHPNLSHLAFVVGELHLLLFAPLVKLVSGVGLFGDEHEALSYLCTARGQPAMVDLVLPHLPPPPADLPVAPHLHTVEQSQRVLGGRAALPRTLPPRPTSRLKGTPFLMHEPRYSHGEQRAGAGDGEPE
jgi:hypothetical protein